MNIPVTSPFAKSLDSRFPKVKVKFTGDRPKNDGSSGKSKASGFRSVTIPYLKKDVYGQPIEDEPYTPADVLSKSDLAHIQELEDRQNANPKVDMTPEEIDFYAKKYYAEKYEKKYPAEKRLPVSEKRYSLVVGLPASGKSTIIEDLQDKMPSVPCTVDDIRRMLPGYKKGDGSRSLMNVARQICEKVFEMALANREPILQESTGRNKSALIELLKKVKKQGYKTYLYLVDIPNKEAIQRVVSRSRIKDSEGRHQFSRPSDVISIGNQHRLVFEDLVQNSGLVDEYAVFDNYKDRLKLVDSSKKES